MTANKTLDKQRPLSAWLNNSDAEFWTCCSDSEIDLLTSESWFLIHGNSSANLLALASDWLAAKEGQHSITIVWLLFERYLYKYIKSKLVCEWREWVPSPTFPPPLLWRWAVSKPVPNRSTQSLPKWANNWVVPGVGGACAQHTLFHTLWMTWLRDSNDSRPRFSLVSDSRTQTATKNRVSHHHWTMPKQRLQYCDAGIILNNASLFFPQHGGLIIE